MNWSDERTQVLQPVNYSARVSTQLLVHSGHWQFAAMFTPPPAPDAGEAAFAPLPGDRVLLFVRAALPGVEAPAVRRDTGSVKTGVVVAEWIETSTSDFAALLAANSPADGLALRKSARCED